jgi:hypothetical protein
MSTIGWFFIITALLLVRQVAKGRVLETADDLSDAFLAIVQGDTKGLTAVLNRSGDSTTAETADLSAYKEAGQTVGGVLNDTAAIAAAGKYNLSSKTKPHVIAAAGIIGPMFGIKNIGGWRAKGSVPQSKHPDGLALDLMTTDKAVGDKIAAYAIANASKFGITEVIWWRRIWSPGRGWRDYNGPSAHTDHVHLTFSEKS